MLLIDPDAKSLQAVPTTTLTAEQIQERYGLQACILANPKPFFDEIGEDLLLVASEVSPSPHIDRRIDLLAIDRDGAMVVIELKRDRHPLQLFQGVSYAALMSDWEPDRLVAARAQLLGVSESEARDELSGFLYRDLQSLNQSQRVVLVAEGYGYDLLATGQWLIDTYGLDIRCVQIQANNHEGANFLACHRVLPAEPLTDLAVNRRRSRPVPERYRDWDEVLATMEDEPQRAFFKEWVGRGQEGDPQKPILFFRKDGARMWWVSARGERSYVWQYKRMADDMAYWKKSLSDAESVKEVNGGSALRFHLREQRDYAAMRAMVEGETPATGGL